MLKPAFSLLTVCVILGIAAALHHNLGSTIGSGGQR